jgi:hypothetical protein
MDTSELLTPVGEKNLLAAQDEIVRLFKHYDYPVDQWPTEVGIRPGTTSVYVWKKQNPSYTPENGNIYMSSVLLNKYPERFVRKVARHEGYHDLQENHLDRDMTDKVASELEAEALAVKADGGAYPKIGGRQTPLLDIFTIKSNPIPASTCFVRGSYYGIQAGESLQCATFDFSEYDGHILLNLLGFRPGGL